MDRTERQNTGLERRDFLKLAVASGAAATFNAALPGISFGAVKPASLDQIIKMSPVQMAESSKIVKEAYTLLQQSTSMIKNLSLRQKVASMLANPAPTFVASMDKGAVYNNLVSNNYLSNSVTLNDFLPPTPDARRSVQPFYSAPGSGYQSHHSYPGGLALHTALNLDSSLGLFEGYKRVNNTVVDRDVVIASQMLHDRLKPWVFQWQAAGDTRAEATIAGTGEHHIYSVAESICQGLPAEVCIAQACAHDHPGTPADEGQVVNWIKAACILIDADPIERGLLSPNGDTLPVPRRIENFICHLGDHDSVLSVPAAQWLIAQMKVIAVNEYGMTSTDLQGLKFNSFRNYVFSQASILYLYLIYSTSGDALVEKIREIVTPA